MHWPGFSVPDYRCIASGRHEIANNALMVLSQPITARVARAAVASAALWAAAAAHAQSIEPARIVAAPSLLPVAAAAAMPTALPAVIAPQAQPAPNAPSA